MAASADFFLAQSSGYVLRLLARHPPGQFSGFNAIRLRFQPSLGSGSRLLQQRFPQRAPPSDAGAATADFDSGCALTRDTVPAQHDVTASIEGGGEINKRGFPLGLHVTFDSPPVRCRMKAAPLGFREVEIFVHAVVIVRSSPGGDSSSAPSLPICWELEPVAAGGGDPIRDTPTKNSINRWQYSNSLCFYLCF